MKEDYIGNCPVCEKEWAEFMVLESMEVATCKHCNKSYWVMPQPQLYLDWNGGSIKFE